MEFAKGDYVQIKAGIWLPKTDPERSIFEALIQNGAIGVVDNTYEHAAGVNYWVHFAYNGPIELDRDRPAGVIQFCFVEGELVEPELFREEPR